ncbi:MAG: hypothetical protein ACM3NS_11225 [Deltaproteobacteria bacterium]
MRTIVLCVAAFLGSACSSSPGSRSPSTAAVAPPADTSSTPVVSPDGSVRRARPDEISTGRAPLASECEGNACGAVRVTWLGPGYRFENTSTREVGVTIWFLAKENCARQEIALPAGKDSGWGNVGFCPPYRATYK